MQDSMVGELKRSDILIIDDDSNSLAALNLMLQKEGYELHEAQSGKEALQHLEKHSVDLVLLDIYMPGLSGYDGCRTIRKSYALDELPILFVTGLDSWRNSLECFEAGGNDYLVKPLRREELLARIKIHLSTLTAAGYRRRLRQAAKHTQEERELRQQLFEERERERRRLAQELHDGPIQDLHALVFALRRGSDSPDESISRLNEAMTNLRAICTELRPPALMYGGLKRSLTVHLGRIQQRHPDIVVQTFLMEDGQRLSEWQRLQLFRIGQEALTNALQHARASTIEVGFELDAEGCCLWVRDNGKGFKVPDRWVELVRDEHFGLVGMAERAESIGGQMTLRSSTAEGQGTEMRIDVLWRDAVSVGGAFDVPDHHFDGRRSSDFSKRNAVLARRTAGFRGDCCGFQWL